MNHLFLSRTAAVINLPFTGDENSLMPFVIAAAVSVAVIAGLIIFSVIAKKKKKQQNDSDN